MEKKMKKILLTLMLLVVCAASMMLCGCSKSEDPSVKCNNGTFVGSQENGVMSFKGVPYAEPPVDELRWKAPVLAEDSDETFEAKEYGDSAIQYEWDTEPASFHTKSEDCLTLNVWTKDLNPDEKKPVMVWIHGGAYGWGGTADPMYDGQNFIEANGDDVILVTINYRLGLMAWADFSQVPGGEEYTDGMLGIRDQICALQWIQKNIEGFGGDPDNVTLFGESAGSTSVAYLMLSPMADGLFHKAIQQSSGIGFEDWKTREDAQEYAAYIMETVGAKDMDDLLAITSDEWVEYDTEYWLADESPNEYIDGEVIPEDVGAAWDAAAKKGIPLLVGTTADERNYDILEVGGLEEMDKIMNEDWDEAYEAVSDEGKANMDRFLELQSDKENPWDKVAFQTELFRIEVVKEVERFLDNGGEAYMYYWDVPSTLEVYNYGACHAVELSYIFNNTDDEIYAGPDQDLEVAEAAQKAWVNFAKTGNPSTDEYEWPSYDKEARNTMMIQSGGWEVISDPMQEIRLMMDDLYSELHGMSETY